MATAAQLEEQLVQSLRQSPDDKAALVTFRQRARLAERNDRFVEMGVIYGAMAIYLSDDLDLPMRAAQAYQRAGLKDDMTRYYLMTIERYIAKSDPTQAAAVLKQFLSISDDAVEIPPSILELCDRHGISHAAHAPSIPALSDDERGRGRLRQHPLFAGLEEKTFSRLAVLMQWHHWPMGHELLRQGDKATEMYFVLLGQIDVFVVDHGQRTSLGHVASGGVCGQVAVLSAGAHVINAMAVSDVEVMALPLGALEQVRSIAPDLLLQMYRDCWQEASVPLHMPLPSLKNLDQRIRQRIHKRMPKVKVARHVWLRRAG